MVLNNNMESIEAKEILSRQSEQLEKEIMEIKNDKQGRASKVFKMKARIDGSKTRGQEAQAIKDPISGELLTSIDEIKRATLEYNVEVLKNNKPEEGFEELVRLKEYLHDKRMDDKLGKGQFSVKKEDFADVIKKFKDKNKKSYDFIVKTGPRFKVAVFLLCKRIIENEEYPACFDLTVLQQIYKGKGSKSDLSNSRFIHLKDWLPRTCDALVVGGMKGKVLASSTKYQIGGQEGHRSQEHLFTLKSVMALLESRGEGFIFQLYDLRKFFDSESLRDVMDTLHDIDIDAKVYRAWYKMSRNTCISVRTGTGVTAIADVGEVIGQGTVGGALASQVNIDRGIDRYFSGSCDEATYGSIRLQPIVFQDDIARISSELRKAQAGNHKLSYIVKEKQLKVHPDKTGYIAVGSKEYQARISREAMETPLMFGDIITKCKVADKYLGDMIHQGGLVASIEATVEDRAGRITAASYEIKAVLDDYRMQAVGGIMGAWDLWNLAVIPSLLNNCSTWIGMNTRMEDKLEAIQEGYLRLMLEVPISTPKVALRAETGMLSMKHRVWEQKINLFIALRRMKDGLAKETLEEQIVQGWPGLAREVQEILGKIGVLGWEPDKQAVHMALRSHDKAEIMEKMMTGYKKLDKIKQDDPTKAKEYMERKAIADSRLIFRMRTEMVKLRDNMRNMYKGDLVNCQACSMGVPESQTHVMFCTGYEDLRLGKDMREDKDLVSFFRDVLKMRERKKT